MVNYMADKENFKEFIRANPTFASYVNSGEMTWQKFYEMYDLYGENHDVWDKYKSIKQERETTKINDLFKKIDVDSIKEHISSAQKALDLVQELTAKGSTSAMPNVVTPRPLNKFFED